MTIRGLDTAIENAIERAKRTKQTICVVQIAENEYVLWREINTATLPIQYNWYRIVKTIRIDDNASKR
jgi:hypothetical protein